MKKGLIIILLALAGLVVTGGLVAGAVIRLIQAVVILVVYLFVKSKVD